MKSILDRYLDRVLVYANKSPDEASVIRREMKDHLLEKVKDLEAKGVPREEAILEALDKHGSPRTIGYGLRGPFPWIDIRSQGTARGVIAVGPKAFGVFAFGGMAVGIFTFGGFSLGLFSVGGFALGLLFAWGGFGVGSIAAAGFAVGLIASGGVALGLVATGGNAIGAWVPRAEQASSYYNETNVPPVFRSMEYLLNIPHFIERHFPIVMTLFLVSLLALNYVMFRARKRELRGDDWLIDG